MQPPSEHLPDPLLHGGEPAVAIAAALRRPGCAGGAALLQDGLHERSRRLAVTAPLPLRLSRRALSRPTRASRGRSVRLGLDIDVTPLALGLLELRGQHLVEARLARDDVLLVLIAALLVLVLAHLLLLVVVAVACAAVGCRRRRRRWHNDEVVVRRYLVDALHLRRRCLLTVGTSS